MKPGARSRCDSLTYSWPGRERPQLGGIGLAASRKPAAPRLNGKVERSHRIDAKAFHRMLEGVVIDDTALFNDRLQEWEDFCNYNRPHGGLGVRLRMRG